MQESPVHRELNCRRYHKSFHVVILPHQNVIITWSRCMLTSLRTKGELTCSKYVMGQRRAAPATIFTMSGSVKAARDIIVPCKVSVEQFSKRGEPKSKLQQPE